MRPRVRLFQHRPIRRSGAAEGSQKWGGTEKRGHKGRSLRLEGPRRRGVLGRGAASPPPHQLWSLGCGVSSVGSGAKSRPKSISVYFWSHRKHLSSNSIWRQKFWGGTLPGLLALKFEEARASVSHGSAAYDDDITHPVRPTSLTTLSSLLIIFASLRLRDIVTTFDLWCSLAY